MQLFDDGHGSAYHRGGEVAWGRSSSLGVVLHDMGLGMGWRGIGSWRSEIVVGGWCLCDLRQEGMLIGSEWGHSFPRYGGCLVG